MHPIKVQPQSRGAGGLIAAGGGLLLLAGGTLWYLRVQSEAQQEEKAYKARIQEDKDRERRAQLLTNLLRTAEVKKRELGLDEWKRWAALRGLTLCITCNGAGRAGGTGCYRCRGDGLDPKQEISLQMLTPESQEIADRIANEYDAHLKKVQSQIGARREVLDRKDSMKIEDWRKYVTERGLKICATCEGSGKGRLVENKRHPEFSRNEPCGKCDGLGLQ